MRTSLVLVAIFNSALSAQQVTTRTLNAPTVEHREPFSGVNAMRELRDGRVLVSDNRDKTLQVVDLVTGAATPVGRSGSGPTEWGMPVRMLGMPGDSTYVYDLLNSRFLVVAPDGKPIRTYSPFAEAASPQITRTQPGGAGAAGASAGRGATDANANATRSGAAISFGGFSISGPSTATATDALGRMYFTGSPFAAAPASGVPEQADSVPLLRQALGSATVDTLAFLRTAQGAVSTSSPGRGGAPALTLRLNSGRPYESGDGWVVFPDGRVVIARIADYHLEVVAPDGRRVARGAPVRYTPVPVTEADKQLWRESRRAATPVFISQGSGGGAPTANTPNITVPEPDSWPEVKSAFASTSVWPAPNGQTWIFRQRAANDPVPVADVFDHAGTLTGKVAFPRNVRVVAFGARGVYAVRTDDDGLQYLQRYAIAWEGCPRELAENCRR